MRKRCAGFTAIEIVLAIALLAVALPPLLHLFAETTVTAARSHALPTATALGSGLMEEIKSRRFDDLAEKQVTGNWSTTLAVDGGETASNKTTFDDVDDFNGWSQNFGDFGAGFTDYTATVAVAYVAVNDLNAPLTIPQPVPDDWTPSYKRIVVTVTNANLPASISLTTVVTEVQSL